MKRHILMSVLITLFVSASAFSQARDRSKGKGRQQKKTESKMQQCLANMKLEQREAQMDFQREMQELELQERKIALERQRKAAKNYSCKNCCRKGKMLPFFIICFVVHILLTIWVYQDIRNRGSGSGLWIVIVLLAGILGILPYTIVRLGDIKQAEK